jgi:hypothetical protein
MNNRKRPVAAVLVPHKRRKRQTLKDSVNKALDQAFASLGVRRTGHFAPSDSFARKAPARNRP